MNDEISSLLNDLRNLVEVHIYRDDTYGRAIDIINILEGEIDEALNSVLFDAMVKLRQEQIDDFSLVLPDVHAVLERLREMSESIDNAGTGAVQ